MEEEVLDAEDLERMQAKRMEEEAERKLKNQLHF